MHKALHSSPSFIKKNPEASCGEACKLLRKWSQEDPNLKLLWIKVARPFLKNKKKQNKGVGG
jgi:hypothetical protein